MKKGTFTSTSKIVCLIFSLVFIVLMAQAQTPPAANLSGPLKAFVGGTNITLTSQISSDVPNPTINYTFDSNSSGAAIVSRGQFVYDRIAGVGTQTLVVSPGSARGSFNIKLVVTTPNGTCESSKSVTVTNARGASTDPGAGAIH